MSKSRDGYAGALLIALGFTLLAWGLGVLLSGCAGLRHAAIEPYVEDNKFGRCVTGGYAVSAGGTTVSTLVSTCLSTGALDAGAPTADAFAPSSDAGQLEPKE